MSKPSGDHFAVLSVCLTDTEKSMTTSSGVMRAGNLNGITGHVTGMALQLKTQHGSVHTHCKPNSDCGFLLQASHAYWQIPGHFSMRHHERT